jgi:Cthe_2314-like HEPN
MFQSIHLFSMFDSTKTQRKMNVSTQTYYDIFQEEFFVKRVLEFSHLFLESPHVLRTRTRRKVLETNPFFEKENPLSEYTSDVFVQTEFIKDSIQSLRAVEHFLTIDEVPDHYISNQIREKDYYRYHIEYYHIKFASIIDFILLLSNRVYRLGFTKNECKYERLRRNENFSPSETFKLIESLRKEFIEIVEGRNLIVHQGDFDHNTIQDIDIEIKMRRILKQNSEEPTLFNRGRERVIKATTDLFNSQINKLELYYSQILVSIVPEIDRQWKIFKLDLNE